MSAQDERAAFDRLVASHLDELLRAARRELRYRIALGQLGRMRHHPNFDTLLVHLENIKGTVRDLDVEDAARRFLDADQE